MHHNFSDVLVQFSQDSLHFIVLLVSMATWIEGCSALVADSCDRVQHARENNLKVKDIIFYYLQLLSIFKINLDVGKCRKVAFVSADSS